MKVNSLTLKKNNLLALDKTIDIILFLISAFKYHLQKKGLSHAGGK